ncbi:MAG: MATE family efflux transporter [Clostridia bacterium]|nr:MATE family efflux transporter [Clostridia bacterium]
MAHAGLFKKKDVDMTVGSIPKLIFGFFLPMVLGLFLQQLYHAVDMIIVGQFCTYQEMSAVGGVGSITNTFVLFCSGISIGAGVVISQYYGKHDGENLKKSVSSSIVISLFLSALMTVLGMALSRPLLLMMKSNADVIEHATLYLLIYFGGVSSIILYNMLSSILQAVGDSTRPLIYLAISSAVNIVLDLVFVAVFRWGVVGAAIATIIAQFVSAGCAFFYLAKSDKDYRIDLKNLKLDKKIGKTIILIGLPTGIQSSITGISNTFVHSYINVFGTSYEGGYAVYIKLDHLVTVFATSFGYALTSFVGQNVGANNVNRACKGTTFTVIMSSIIIFLVSLPMVIFSEAVTSLFTHDASVTQSAAYIITMLTPFHVISSIHTCYMSALRGYKKTRTSMFIVLGSFVAFRQIYLFIVSRIFAKNLIAVLLAFPLGWALSAILHAICWFNCPVPKAKRILKKHPEASHLTPEELVSWKKQGYPPLATQQVA